MSRIEGFSDAVFGFAITLLVISNEVPRNTAQLVGMWHQLLPFMASFAVLFGLWRAQFDFFRRYGLEDRRTIRLTGALMMIVLLAVYPVRFLFGFLLDVLPTALWRNDESMKLVATIDDLPKVMLIYSLGVSGVAFVFSRLYRHAGTLHGSLGLSPLERFDTHDLERRWLGASRMALAVCGSCIVALLAGPHRAWGTTRTVGVWVTAYACVLVPGMVTARERRRRARERDALLRAAPLSLVDAPGETPAGPPSASHFAS